ncbi:hypothetical protein HY090_01825 [Candidatus Kaiserbacteria bacterium]|nr:hypothetical protein [Candidatus Kaiserbacteria bacterium]
MKRILIFSTVAVLLLPLSAFAVTTNQDLISIVTSVFKPIFTALVPIAAAFALLGFLWGLTMFIWNANNEKKKAEGKYVMLWGVITLFVMFSIWGIVSLFQGTFKLQTEKLHVPSADSKANGLNY